MFSRQSAGPLANENSKKTLPAWIEKMLPPGTAHEYFDSTLGSLHFLHRGSGRQVVLGSWKPDVEFPVAESNE